MEGNADTTTTMAVTMTAVMTAMATRMTTPTIHKNTSPLDWSMHKPDGEGRLIGGWCIEPILYTRGNKLFEVNMMAQWNGI